MEKYTLIFIFSVILGKLYSQEYDLIVKSSGDSIICNIDSITDESVYFEMKYQNHWTHTYVSLKDVTGYYYDTIPKIIEDTNEKIKNVVYGTAGFMGVWAVMYGNYERMILERKDKFLNTLWLRAGGGWFAGWSTSGIHVITGLTLLTGKRNHHFDLNLGLGISYDKSGYEIEVRNARFSNDPQLKRSDFIDFFPAGGLGYRFQKPLGHFVFRTGFSFPETAYLSIGFSF